MCSFMLMTVTTMSKRSLPYFTESVSSATMPPTLSIEDQVAAAADAFEQHFGGPPPLAVAAPGRVNLIGEHTDYNDGFVLPIAIERQTVLVARPSGSATCRVATVSDGDEATFDAYDALAPGEPSWANYVKGVVAMWRQRGLEAPGFEAMVHSTVPIGGGLSSSASLEVATATLLETMTGQILDLKDKALLCQKAEHEFPKVPCGIMDQFASVFGKPGAAMKLDCRSQQIEQVPFDDGDVTILIANSNVKHELTGGEYAQRRRQCEAAAEALGVAALRDAEMTALMKMKKTLDPTTFKRAYHVIGEIERTVRAAALLETGDWSGFGRLMYDSHTSLRDAFEVSCGELDALVAIAESIGPSGGVFGSRMTGGGFGGCTVTLVRRDKVDAVTRRLYTEYVEATSIEPTLFATRPAAGARVVRG